MTDKLTIAVIGATGRTGVPLVAQALDRGHRVRALARSPEKAARVLPDDIDVVVGNASDHAAMRRLVDGVDVVIDASGPVRGGSDDYRQRSTEALLDALGKHDDVPLIHLTGAGVRRSGDRPGLVDRAVRGLMLLVARPLLHDSTAAVEAIHASGRKALVVRVPRLTDGPPSGQYHVARVVGDGSGMQITRADVAAALLDLAETDAWPDGAPVVSAGRRRGVLGAAEQRAT